MLKIIFNIVEGFHNQSFFYSSCNKFWVVQTSFSIATMLDKINVKEKAKSILTLTNTLYTTIPHKLLLKVVSAVINFVFKSKVRKLIGFSKTSIYWTSKGAGRRYFTKQTLVNAMPFLINKCFFILLTCFLNKILVY